MVANFHKIVGEIGKNLKRFSVNFAQIDQTRMLVSA